MNKQQQNYLTRFDKGMAIAKDCRIYHVKDKSEWRIESQTHKGEFYNLAVSCSCPDFKNVGHKMLCKHFIGLVEKIKQDLQNEINK